MRLQARTETMPIMVIGGVRMLRRSKLPSTGPTEAMQMEGQSDDVRFEQDAGMRDGRVLAIRLMRPDDKQRLVAAFAKLDRQSIYTRFKAEVLAGHAPMLAVSRCCQWPMQTRRSVEVVQLTLELDKPQAA
jgi:hypothetical protein